MLKHIVLFVGGLVLLVSAVAAQDDVCPAIVETALSTTRNLCDSTLRNQACYGNAQLDAQSHPDVTDFKFTEAGDRVMAADMQSLQLSPMQQDQGYWGVALLRLQANLPDDELQDVTLLAFGDVQIRDAFTRDSAPAQPTYRPMQAFYFQSGEEQPGCASVPASGMLIQTPEGVGEVRLLINEINISLGSTVFFQSQSGQEMTVATLTGHARVEAMGVSQTATAGMQIRIPLDDNNRPSAPPSPPEPYQIQVINRLPIGNLPLALPSNIVIEGTVEAVNNNTITLYGFIIQLPPTNQTIIQVGDTIHIEGNLNNDGNVVAVMVSTPIPTPVANPVRPNNPNPPGGGNPPPNPGGGHNHNHDHDDDDDD